MDSIGSTNEFAKRLLIKKATPEITIPTEKQKIKEDYPGELGELAHSLNYMAYKIDKAEQMKN
jgi:hypothetical protein